MDRATRGESRHEKPELRVAVRPLRAETKAFTPIDEDKQTIDTTRKLIKLKDLHGIDGEYVIQLKED